MATLKALAGKPDPERALAEEVKKLERADRPEPQVPPVAAEVMGPMPSQVDFDARIKVVSPVGEPTPQQSETIPTITPGNKLGGLRRVLAGLALYAAFRKNRRSVEELPDPDPIIRPSEETPSELTGISETPTLTPKP